MPLKRKGREREQSVGWFTGGSGAGMPGVAATQPRGVAGVNAGLDGNAAGISNLETIIAATVRAVTGQLRGLDGSSDGTMLQRNTNQSAMPGMDMSGAGSGAYAANRWPNVIGADGVGGAWDTTRRTGGAGMPSADAVRSGMLASDNDPNTLYVGNVSSYRLPRV